MNKEKNTEPNNIKQWLYSAYLTITYKVFYLKDERRNGWFIMKNPITMLLIAPIGIPLFMLYGIVLYCKWATNYRLNWIQGDKRKLTFNQKLKIKKRIVNLGKM